MPDAGATPHSEYLRRNRIVAQAYGAHAEVEAAIARMKRGRFPSKWILRALEEIAVRTAPLPLELAQWRDIAADRPVVDKPQSKESMPAAAA